MKQNITFNKLIINYFVLPKSSLFIFSSVLLPLILSSPSSILAVDVKFGVVAVTANLIVGDVRNSFRNVFVICVEDISTPLEIDPITNFPLLARVKIDAVELDFVGVVEGVIGAGEVRTPTAIGLVGVELTILLLFVEDICCVVLFEIDVLLFEDDVALDNADANIAAVEADDVVNVGGNDVVIDWPDTFVI